MTGVLKTILFLILIYYVWKVLFRIFFPIVAKKMMEKAQDRMHENMRQKYGGQHQEEEYAKQEGEVVIQRGVKESRKGNVSESEGEYVDFEEVKD